ncbi:hypothetical protein BH10PSE1_BH10PSE1_13830 [soil metagenome]
MKFKERTLDALADMVVGNGSAETSVFPYRSSSYITRLFRDADTDYAHNGSTRAVWAAATIAEMLAEPHPNAQTPPEAFCRLIDTLMDPDDAQNEGRDRPKALEQLNSALKREGFEAFYAEDDHCYLRHIGTNTIVMAAASPHRPFSKIELERKDNLVAYLDKASEDDLIEEILLPLFRQLGFHRITAAGHREKALEYGKDIWMKYTLPTQHVLYFGLQVKKGKLDSSGVTGATNANVAEIHNQVTMMLGHEIFDPELNRRVLVDHAFIIAGGHITKAARNWLGNKLDQNKRSQILFMDREDILNLFIVTGLPLPPGATPNPAAASYTFEDDIPF